MLKGLVQIERLKNLLNLQNLREKNTTYWN